MAASADPDYVELELPREAMTLEYLTVASCEELGVEADQVTKSTWSTSQAAIVQCMDALTESEVSW